MLAISLHMRVSETLPSDLKMLWVVCEHIIYALAVIPESLGSVGEEKILSNSILQLLDFLLRSIMPSGLWFYSFQFSACITKFQEDIAKDMFLRAIHSLLEHERQGIFGFPL